MPKIMADHNVEGHLQVLMTIWSSPEWDDLWTGLSCEIESFERLAIPTNVADTELWEACQQNEIVLVTGNRNADGENSLEVAINQFGTSRSLPVLTIADPDRLMRERDYAERVAAQLLE